MRIPVLKSVNMILISLIILFLEVALIRWISTEIRIFAYVNNLVILSCFLGIGVGCYLSNKRCNLSLSFLLPAVVLLLVYLPFNVPYQGHHVHLFRDTPILLGAFSDSLIWDQMGAREVILSAALGILSTLFIFFVILFTFIPLGQTLGCSLNEFGSPVLAYSLNIGASIAGVLFFGWLSFAWSPPWIWFLSFCLASLALVLLQEKRTVRDLASILALMIAATLTFDAVISKGDKSFLVWSPYQKLQVNPSSKNIAKIDKGYVINVNNIGFMGLMDLSDKVVRAHPEIFDLGKRIYGQYDIPYLFKNKAEDVLIVGAGGGNDVAGAIRNGAIRIDAVEIDPAIYALGTRLHPERPYSDPRVHVIIDDARSAFKRLSKKYDLISFGLLDSHTTSSSYNNVRLDHYVYTEESLREAKGLLKSDGVLTVIFCAQQPWIEERLYRLIQTVFGEAPSAFFLESGNFGWGGSMFVAGNKEVIDNAMKAHPGLREREISSRLAGRDISSVKLTTDDWPYLYLARAAIPKMHLCIMAILAVIFFVSRRTLMPAGQRVDLHFFFLGAAFLLLEFQNISKTALLFGSTWMVNVFTITAILLLALCANVVVTIFKKINIVPIYAALVFYTIFLYFVPLGIFNNLGHLNKAVSVSILLNLPVFFSGIIFTRSFSMTARKDEAFGSNVLGAVVGGVLESLSFVVGIRALLLVTAGFYALSYLFLRKR